jgi:DeoR/GlpR family transcriptional regulator of sugar metabolism
VVTNSLPAAAALHLPDDHGLTVVLTGGTRTPSDALVGPVATRSLETMRVDVTFLGVHGIDLEAGLTTPNLLEAETDRALVTAARRTVVLADHTKWGAVGLSRIVPLADVAVLVTDDALPPEAVEDLESVVGTLVLAPTGAERTRPPGGAPESADPGPGTTGGDL